MLCAGSGKPRCCREGEGWFNGFLAVLECKNPPKSPFVPMKSERGTFGRGCVIPKQVPMAPDKNRDGRNDGLGRSNFLLPLYPHPAGDMRWWAWVWCGCGAQGLASEDAARKEGAFTYMK